MVRRTTLLAATLAFAFATKAFVSTFALAVLALEAAKAFSFESTKAFAFAKAFAFESAKAFALALAPFALSFTTPVGGQSGQVIGTAIAVPSGAIMARGPIPAAV